MKGAILTLSLAVAMVCPALDAAVKTIPQIAQMFQKVRVSDLPYGKEWTAAMDAVRDKLASMPLDITSPTGIGAFFDNIDAFQVVMRLSIAKEAGYFSRLSKSNRSSALATLSNEQANAEKLAKKKVGFGQKVKSFFGKKSQPTEEENLWELLRGALDLLKAKVAALKKEDMMLTKQGT
jgi:hypothetical protein